MFTSVTLKQISNLSGYSISTVSKALNNRHDINELTRSKIQKIAAHNNYVPNNSARALRNRKTKVIAVIIPEITNSYFNTFVSEIQKKAFSVGYRILILQSFNDLEKEKECINLVNDGSVDGILILSNTKFKDLIFKTLTLNNFMAIPFHENLHLDHEGIKNKAYNSFKDLFVKINSEV